MSNPDSDGDVETLSFPYEHLPNEMKVPILENIHDPQDKLNILDVLPSTEWLMGWDYTSLKFELIYPLVFQYLKWPHEKKTRSWKNLLNLCKVSPEFQRIVTSHFQKHITSTHSTKLLPYFRDYRQAPILTGDSLKNILEATSDSTSPPWHKTIPFLIATDLNQRCQVPFLTKLGKKVWSLGLSLLGAYNNPGNIDYLVECLHLVPNLRRLDIADFYPPEFSQYDLPPEILHEESLVLPELPDLKMVSLIQDCNKFQQWVLPKYTRQLEVLDFNNCYLNDNFSPSCFPKVEAINIHFIPDTWREYLNVSIDNVNALLNKFLLSPLKTITVSLEKVDLTKFFNFMLTLNSFGNTLDTLEMWFGDMNAEMEDEVENELEGWISRLNFPKLSCLHLSCYVGPLEFLLKMPALKKLNIVTNGLEPLKVSSEKGLKITVTQEGMLESPIWQLFPLLDWLQVNSTVFEEMDNMAERDADGRPYLPFRRYAYNITRQMYERHQRNKKN